MADNEESGEPRARRSAVTIHHEEVNEEFDSPVGIEELKVEGFAEKERARAAPRDSVGSAQFAAMRDNAKRTLRGLRWFQWTARFATLANLVAMPAVALLIFGLFTTSTAGYGWVRLVGVLIGVVAFVFFLLAILSLVMGVYYSHRGRRELGVLQQREIVRSRHKLARASIVGAGGAAITFVIGLQAETPTREALIDNAMLFSVIAAVVAAALMASLLSAALQSYVRNLAPRAGRRARTRFRRYFSLAAVPTLVVALAGAPQIVLEYQQACGDLGTCPQDRILGLAAPGYGPASALFVHPLFVSLGVVTLALAGLLLLSRLFALGALRAWRIQLVEAERLIMDKVRAKATPLSAVMGEAPPENIAVAE